MLALGGDSWLDIELIYWFAGGRLYVYWHDRRQVVIVGVLALLLSGL